MKRLAVLVLPVVVAVAGCGQNMTHQPKYEQYEPAHLFQNGRVLQSPVPGTISRDDPAFEAAKTSKPPLTRALLERGRHQHDVFCAPCHARTGDGDGMVVQRGMPRPPSYHSDKLHKASDQHLFDVISNGYGVMYAYGARISPGDRWAIVAYMRALQLSQNARLEDVPAAERGRLAAQAHQ
jgi:cytochrome c553